MAVSAAKMVGVSEDSSSSDEEEFRRCKEAVWEATTKTKHGESNAKESKRVVVADHEHDGNELQVTQGFRTHVAKKLGLFLDSCISERQSETSSHLKSTNCEGNDDDDDEGFRLFSTSIPGQKAVEPPAPVRRRPVPSSSDSDSEMETRLREAAVSIKDLLPSSTLPSTLSPSSESLGSARMKKKKMSEEEEGHAVKKKKKRKPNKVEGEQGDSAGPAATQSNGEHGNPEQELTEVTVKKKKKKKRQEEPVST